MTTQSLQKLHLLQNLYRLKALGFEYIEHISFDDSLQQKENAKASSLTQLTQQIQICHLCDLSKSRKQPMSGFGHENADLFFIDFSVSQTQDENNSYFMGRSGESLKSMIEKVIGVEISQVYLTHIIKCKALLSQAITPTEINTCKEYLFSQLAFVKPKVIVTLGKDAYEHLTGDFNNFETVRGHIIAFGDAKLIPIYHPQFLLRNPQLKKITLTDLKTIKSSL